MERNYFYTTPKELHRPLSNLLLSSIVLLEGFVSIGVEIITIRQLLPVVGGSVVVTSLIIGIFLLFLALGYKKGGQVSTHLEQKLLRNFFIAAIWLGIGLSYAFIMSFFMLFQKYITSHVIYPLLTYLLLIIAPLIYLLGQTIPLSMNLNKNYKSVGGIGGDILSLSTIGSFLGATVTSMLLMHFLGVAWTIFINFLILTGLAFCIPQQKIFWWGLIMIPLAWFIYGINISAEHNLFKLTNDYANYQILNKTNYPLKADEKILSINNSLSSHTDSKQQGFSYIEFIKGLIFDQLGIRNSEILILGAGGFSFSAEKDLGNKITYVDIDKTIPKVVVPHFLKQIKGNFIAEDGRSFVHITNKHFAAIIIDAYTNVRSIPAYLLTYQFMQDLHKILNPNGIIVFNMVANPMLSDPYSKRIDNTVRAVFKNCMVIPAYYKNMVMNILYVCTNASNEKDNMIYSDNKNTSTTDAFDW